MLRLLRSRLCHWKPPVSRRSRPARRRGGTPRSRTQYRCYGPRVSSTSSKHDRSHHLTTNLRPDVTSIGSCRPRPWHLGEAENTPRYCFNGGTSIVQEIPAPLTRSSSQVWFGACPQHVLPPVCRTECTPSPDSGSLTRGARCPRDVEDMKPPSVHPCPP